MFERPQCFGRLKIDWRENSAALNGTSIELSPLLFRLLCALSERPNRLVTRAELKAMLWPGSERIDTEHRLNTAMRALRVALDDNVDGPRFVETVRGYGYRWVASQSAAPPFVLATRVPALFACAVGAGALLLLSPGHGPQPTMVNTARVQMAMDEWRGAPSAATQREASMAVARLAAQDAESPTAHVMRAELALGGQWNWAEAQAEYERALRLDAGNIDARLGLAWLKAAQGKRDEALELVAAILGGGLVEGERRIDLGWLLLHLRRPDLASELCRDSATASINELSCAHAGFAQLHRFTQARTTALALMRRVGAEPAAITGVSEGSGQHGYQKFLQWRAAHFLPRQATSFQRAQVLADAGYYSRALTMLSRSIESHEPSAIKIAAMESFAPLRPNRRFQSLERAVGASA
jgi:DNA-binding winged helix-turn-helix (wHTH) protein